MPRGLLFLVAMLLAACSSPTAVLPWPMPRARASRPGDHPEVRPLLPSMDRRRAPVLALRVRRATRANLDLAAYAANPILYPAEAEPLSPEPPPAFDRARLFGAAIVPESIVSSLAATPLAEAEKAHPLAFVPLCDYLSRWNAERARPLEEARAAVREESWGIAKRPGAAFQQIALVYLHQSASGTVELWARIEFEPWAHIFPALPDEDGDGYPEIYGRLRPDLVDPAVVSRLKSDYLGRVLSSAEVHLWANELASLWYPTRNTDVVRPLGERSFPLTTTEPEIRSALGAARVQGPTVIIRGRPEGRAIYNVLVVDGVSPLDRTSASAAGPAKDESPLKQFPVSAEVKSVIATLEQNLARNGASYDAWAQRVAPYHQAILETLKRRPAALMALEGRDGFLFFRRSLEYVVGGDLEAQPPRKNPLPAIVEFKEYLQRLGVDFLLVPVPAKAEVFPDKIAGLKLPRGSLPDLNPYGSKLLLSLARRGVESVPLLPRYLEERGRAGAEELYQPQDTHWTSRGLRLAAAALAERVRKYPWYGTLARGGKEYTEHEVRFTRQGDLQSRLAPREQRRYRPQRLAAQQVKGPDGELYVDDAASPIVVLGDSFTGVYQLMDCGSSGLTAHLARELATPIDLVMSYGGGPSVRRQLLSRGEAALRRMRLLIWVFAARDLYNYWDDWAPLGELAPAATQPSH